MILRVVLAAIDAGSPMRRRDRRVVQKLGKTDGWPGCFEVIDVHHHEHTQLFMTVHAGPIGDRMEAKIHQTSVQCYSQ